MKLLIDMNLSPDWVPVLGEKGFEALHWSQIGMPHAPDREIMAWAKANGYVLFAHDLDFGAILAATRANGYVLFAHDLDFGAILAATRARGPSVVQIRTQDVNPHHVGNFVQTMLNQFAEYLEKGALISIDEAKSRVHILPLID